MGAARRATARTHAAASRERDDGADRVDRLRAASRAPAVGDGIDHGPLKLGGHVHDDAVGLRETPAVVHEPGVVRVLLVHQQRREARRGHGRQPRHVHRALHLLELHGHLVVEHRQAEEEREHGGVGGEVDVCGHGEVAGQVEDRGAKEVHDEGRHGGGQAGDGRPDVRRVHLHEPGHELLDPDEVHRRRDGGEVDEAGIEARGLLLPAYVAVDLRRVVFRRGAHHEHAQGQCLAAVREQALAGLQHGHEVPDAPHRQQHHGRGWGRSRHRSARQLSASNSCFVE
jgi:hypothetical protein